MPNVGLLLLDALHDFLEEVYNSDLTTTYGPNLYEWRETLLRAIDELIAEARHD